MKDSKKNDHYMRTSLGFQLSSPKYFDPILNTVAGCYFDGVFPEFLHGILVEISNSLDTSTEPIETMISERLMGEGAKTRRRFLSSLYAYIHSGIQTTRMKIANPGVEQAFRKVCKKLPIQFFVRKVDYAKLNRWPNLSIVCINLYIYI